MPSSNLKPQDEAVLIDLDEQRYRQTFMFSATMPPQVSGKWQLPSTPCTFLPASYTLDPASYSLLPGPCFLLGGAHRQDVHA